MAAPPAAAQFLLIYQGKRINCNGADGQVGRWGDVEFAPPQGRSGSRRLEHTKTAQNQKPFDYAKSRR